MQALPVTLVGEPGTSEPEKALITGKLKDQTRTINEETCKSQNVARGILL